MEKPRETAPAASPPGEERARRREAGDAPRAGDVSAARLSVEDEADGRKSFLLNIGPSHPAMHGIIRIVADLDGETIRKADVEIGYLHRAFEKEAENVSWNGVVPYTDRLNYVSPLINNFGYCRAVEKLLDLRPPERALFLRTLLAEISRVTDHLTCIGASAMELGAFTAFLYFMQARELLYELVEDATGARITTSFGRVGGVRADLPAGFAAKAAEMFRKVRGLLKDTDKLLTRNRIFVDRLRGVGVISRETALSYGIMGPWLRSTGLAHDLRKAEPYDAYDRVSFDVPTGEAGDNYDRYLVRMEEIRQSLHICEQCLARLPGGEVLARLPAEYVEAAELVDAAKHGQTQGLLEREARLSPNLEGQESAAREALGAGGPGVVSPPLTKAYRSIEGLMNHFMLIMEGQGVKPPPGDAYAAVEGANGELGFYVVSNGTGRPHRVRVHSPCFVIMAALDEILPGHMVADLIATFGSVNMIGGELDR